METYFLIFKCKKNTKNNIYVLISYCLKQKNQNSIEFTSIELNYLCKINNSFRDWINKNIYFFIEPNEILERITRRNIV